MLWLKDEYSAACGRPARWATHPQFTRRHMENYKLVMPGDLNSHGYLFGGKLLMWVDEYAYIGAKLDFPDCRLVTIALDKVEFRKSIRQGTVLKFVVSRSRLGKTSVQYTVDVLNSVDPSGGSMFMTVVTYVRVDESGAKQPLPEPVSVA